MLKRGHDDDGQRHGDVPERPPVQRVNQAVTARHRLCQVSHGPSAVPIPHGGWGVIPAPPYPPRPRVYMTHFPALSKFSPETTLCYDALMSDKPDADSFPFSDDAVYAGALEANHANSCACPGAPDYQCQVWESGVAAFRRGLRAMLEHQAAGLSIGMRTVAVRDFSLQPNGAGDDLHVTLYSQYGPMNVVYPNAKLLKAHEPGCIRFELVGSSDSPCHWFVSAGVPRPQP